MRQYGIPVHDERSLDAVANGGGSASALTPDIAYQRLAMVNVFFVGAPDAGDRGWTLVDAGLPGTADRIANAAAARYGPDARPAAIVLTHGHFDHVGALKTLAERWDVPVYAHALELPYLDGRSAYPPPEPMVGGGMMARLSPLYPKGPATVGPRLRALPDDGGVPGMPGWRWIAAPGHTAGQVAFWRLSDRSLIAGDAVVTTRQESARAVMTQAVVIHGPPAYFTSDWDAAGETVQQLADLEPELLATGHGRPLKGPVMRETLHRLAREFDRVARPTTGRYADAPAITDERGVVAIPPAVRDPVPLLLAGVGVAVLAGVLLSRSRSARGDRAIPDDELRSLDV